MNRDEYYAALYANRAYLEEHSDELAHHGIQGQKWGVRRYQNPDGTLTEEGKKRYGKGQSLQRLGEGLGKVSQFRKDADPIAKGFRGITGGLSGASMGATIGFTVGGPIGAAVAGTSGAVGGALGGLLRNWVDKKVGTWVLDTLSKGSSKKADKIMSEFSHVKLSDLDEVGAENKTKES